MNSIKTLALAAAALSAAPAVAAPVTYFGENQSPAFTVTGAPVTARNSFLAQLSGVSSESFETFALGADPASLTFNGSAGLITASLTGDGIIENNAGGAGSGGNAFGRFATQGTQYYETSSNFGMTFSEAVAAFGFYATDIGDFSGQLRVTLTRTGGGSSDVLLVPHTLGGNDGSLLFFGVIDTMNPFNGVQFSTTSGSDFFGFDQMVVGDVRQVTGGVPEPATWAMMILGFGTIGYAARRRRRVNVSFA